VNAESFRRLREAIASHHVTIGTVMCGLAVKFRLWEDRFPNQGGGPSNRLEFVESEIQPGLNTIMQATRELSVNENNPMSDAAE
jgi:hypothetical protein